MRTAPVWSSTLSRKNRLPAFVPASLVLIFQSGRASNLMPIVRLRLAGNICQPGELCFRGILMATRKSSGRRKQRLKNTIATVFPNFLTRVIEERKIIVPVMNGNVLTPAQSKPHRPDTQCSLIQGLYFIGDTVRGDGCSGDISFSSAMKAVDKILGAQIK